MNKSILMLVIFCTKVYCAEEHFYKITINGVDNGDQVGYYVKSDLNEIEMAKTMGTKEAIIFRQYYVYISTSDKWEVVNKWDDLRTGLIIVRGDNILSAEKLVTNPETHESKDRLFRSVPVKKTDTVEQK